MKKLFTLLTLLLCAVTSSWGAVICTAQVPTGQDGTFSNTEGTTVGQTGCTLKWSGLQGGANTVTVSGVDYYKFGSDGAYVQLVLTSGKFQAGDVLTATVTSNGSNKTVNVKVNETATSTVTVSSTETKNITYTLTAADIESDGSIKIYRGTSAASNLRGGVFSVARASEKYTVTFNAGSNGTCGTASLTEASVGAGVTLPAVTPNSGYAFTGWYTAASEGTKVGNAGDTYKPAANITLYAQYGVSRIGYNTYYVAEDESTGNGEKVVCDDIIMEYQSTSAFTAATEDNMINALNSNYVASIKSSANGWGVEFTPSANGTLLVGLIANNGKTFSITNVTSFDYLDKDGNLGTNASNSWTPEDKFYGIVAINVVSGTKYKFSVAGSKLSFYGFEFVPSTSGATVLVGQYEWATFVSDKALNFTGLDVKAYTVTGASGTSITKSDALTNVPANTPLLLNGSKGSYIIPKATSASSVGTNLLVAGTGASVAADANAGFNYVLGVESSAAMFLRIGTTPATVPVGKAYLALTENPAGSRTLDMGGEVTAIKNIKVGTEDNVYYDLQGRRVLYPTKGLYIVNGKKVIIK